MLHEEVWQNKEKNVREKPADTKVSEGGGERGAPLQPMETMVKQADFLPWNTMLELVCTLQSVEECTPQEVRDSTLERVKSVSRDKVS